MIFETARPGDEPARLSYGEPWGFQPGIEPGELRLIDIHGRIAAIVTGLFEERIETAERIATCVNFCAGNSTELLTALKSAAGAATGSQPAASHTWNIDARGSSDPAAVRVAVQRGIVEAAEPLAWPRRAAEDVPSPLHASDERTGLVLLLMQTARSLAASQVTLANGFESIAICASCGEQTPAGKRTFHRPTCLAAEVARIVARLCEFREVNLKRKEETSGR